MSFTKWIMEREGFDSEYLFREMAVQSPTAINKITSALQFVTKYHLNRCVIIGGMAVAHYTQRSITPDVDFMCDNIQAVEQALQQEQLLFKPLASVVMSSVGENLSGIHVPDLDADFLDAKHGSQFINKYILDTAKTTRIGGISVPIIDPNVLAIYKFQIGRDKDTDDAFKLLPSLNKGELRQHLKALAKNLKETDAKTIWSYAVSL